MQIKRLMLMKTIKKTVKNKIENVDAGDVAKVLAGLSLTAILAMAATGLYFEKNNAQIQRDLFVEFNKAVSDGKFSLNEKDCTISHRKNTYTLKCSKPKN